MNYYSLPTKKTYKTNTYFDLFEWNLWVICETSRNEIVLVTIPTASGVEYIGILCTELINTLN